MLKFICVALAVGKWSSWGGRRSFRLVSLKNVARVHDTLVAVLPCKKLRHSRRLRQHDHDVLGGLPATFSDADRIARGSRPGDTELNRLPFPDSGESW